MFFLQISFFEIWSKMNKRNGGNVILKGKPVISQFISGFPAAEKNLFF